MMKWKIQLRKMHYILAGVFVFGLFAYFFSQTLTYFSLAAESSIGSGGRVNGRQASSLRGCWSKAQVNFAEECEEASLGSKYSICGTDTPQCTYVFDSDGDGNQDAQIDSNGDGTLDTSTAGKTLNCDTCRWDTPPAAACRDSQPDGDTATDDNDYERNCRYTSCTQNGGTLTCDEDSGATTNCSAASKSWSVSACPACTAEGSGAMTYAFDTYQYHCTTGAADKKKNKKYKSSVGDCKPPQDSIEDCRDCTQNDYSNNCTYNYSQCRSSGGTKTKTCTLATDQCRYTTTFTTSSYTFQPESCRDCVAGDYSSSCTWDYSKCQASEKTKRQTCSLATDQCRYTSTYTATSHTFSPENCRDCTASDYTSNCTEDTSTCSTTGKKSKTCKVATNQCRFTATYTSDTYTFTNIACVSCPDSSYTTDCVYDSQCAASGANAGKVKKTCKKNSTDCAEATRDFYETCPDCQYSAWALDSNQCDPTTQSTPAQTNEKWKRTKNQNNLSYCKELATAQDRSCRECGESDLYDCTPASWSGIQCLNGEKTRVCTRKTLAVGNPGCSLPTETRQREITGNDTIFGQQSLTTGCSSGAGSLLPAGQNGSTMIYINNGWAASSFLYHKYSANDKRIGIGTTAPSATLELVSPDTAKSSRIRITDTNPAGANATTNPELQLQYGGGNDHWGLYVSNVATTTGAMPSPPQTIASDKSLRIWGFGADRVIVDQNGYVHATKFCTNMDTTAPCTEITGGGGGESLWVKGGDNSISYDTAAVKIGSLNGLGIIGGTSSSSPKPYTYFKGASTQAADISYTLPAAIGTDGQFLKLGANGAMSWSDRGGIYSLNRLSDGEQLFADTDDTNVTLSITSASASSKGTHTFALGWTGVLGADRGGLGLVLTSAAPGTAGNLLRVKAGGTAWEMFTPDYISKPTSSDTGFLKSTSGVLSWASEADPKVGTLTNKYLPRWSAGTDNKLVDSAIFDDGGKIGIGTAKPTTPLTITGTRQNPDATSGTCTDGRIHFNEDGSAGTTINNGECKHAIVLDPDNGKLQITKDAGVGKVLISDASGNGSWQILKGLLPDGTAQGQTLWWDQSDSDNTKWKWVADNKLTINANGSVGIGEVTDDDFEVSKFVVKSNDKKSAFHVGFQGNDTTISSTPYPHSSAGIYLMMPTGADEQKIIDGNKIELTYYVMNGGTRNLESISVVDTGCRSITQSVKTSSDATVNGKNTGDTNNNGKLDAMTMTSTPVAPDPERWKFTCTTDAISDKGIAEATTTAEGIPLASDGRRLARVTSTKKWRAKVTTIGAPVGAPGASGIQNMGADGVTSRNFELSSIDHGCSTDQKWCGNTDGTGYCTGKNDICWNYAAASSKNCQSYYGEWCVYASGGGWCNTYKPGQCYINEQAACPSNRTWCTSNSVCAPVGDICYASTKETCISQADGYWMQDAWSGWCVDKKTAYVTTQGICENLGRTWCPTNNSCAPFDGVCYAQNSEECLKQPNAEWCPYTYGSGECLKRGTCSRFDKPICEAAGRTWCPYPDGGGKCAESGKDCFGNTQ